MGNIKEVESFYQALSLIGLSAQYEKGKLPFFFEGLKEAGYSEEEIKLIKKEFIEMLELVPASNTKILVKELLVALQD